MVAVTCKQQVRNRALVGLSLSTFSYCPQSGKEMGNRQRTWDSRLIASVPGGVLKITRKRGAQVTFVIRVEMLGCVVSSFLTMPSLLVTHTHFSTWLGSRHHGERLVSPELWALSASLLTLGIPSLGERGSDWSSLSHSTWSTQWGGVWPKPSGGFWPPSCPVGDFGLGTVSGQLMVPRGAGLVSLPKLGSGRNNLVDKERALELCSSEEGIEWPCRWPCGPFSRDWTNEGQGGKDCVPEAE